MRSSPSRLNSDVESDRRKPPVLRVSRRRRLVAVQVSPATATVTSTQSVQFTALVKNTSQVAVSWTATGGADLDDRFLPGPQRKQRHRITVTATSVADPTKSETASVTITPAQSAPAAPPTSTRAKPTTPAIKESFFGADFNGSEHVASHRWTIAGRDARCDPSLGRRSKVGPNQHLSRRLQLVDSRQLDQQGASTALGRALYYRRHTRICWKHSAAADPLRYAHVV